MFCANCGIRILDETSAFCSRCGAPVGQPQSPPAPIQAPPTYAAAAPPPAPASTTPPAEPGGHVSKCAWCRALVDANLMSCPNCGAAIDGRPAVASSGWLQAPGRKDMAKLQFGNSFCQIEGSYVPVADMNLFGDDSVYFTHHVLLWKEPQVTISTMSMKGGWKRLFAGMPLIMTQARGPGHIAFSHDSPGELITIPLQPAQAIDVREHLFLVATSGIGYDWFSTDLWFRTKNGDETETHYPVGMFMDRFSAGPTPGLLLLHAGGNVFIRELEPNQTILVKPTALIFKSPSVQMHLHFEHPSAMFRTWGSWSNRYLWLRLTGPGRVAVQSVFERMEGESRNIMNYSYATERRW